MVYPKFAPFLLLTATTFEWANSNWVSETSKKIVNKFPESTWIYLGELLKEYGLIQHITQSIDCRRRSRRRREQSISGPEKRKKNFPRKGQQAVEESRTINLLHSLRLFSINFLLIDVIKFVNGGIVEQISEN